MKSKVEEKVSIFTLISEAVKDLRMYGCDFVLGMGLTKRVKTKSKQAEYADLLGVKGAFYSRLESGSSAFNIAQLHTLCEAKGLSLGELFTYVDHMKKDLIGAGYQVVTEALPIDQDAVRKDNWIEEKATALNNKWTREQKSLKQYKDLTDQQIVAKRQEHVLHARFLFADKFGHGEDVELQGGQWDEALAEDRAKE
ncbi:helix-turn-helix domain-containing protein [Vibrio splendidus]|uniref:helix-turn-helix domain-containing protein n=1 Tax=Vibrio sp. 10N.261.45.A4 TaxID=3229655 RepID=UPI00355185BF